MKKIPNIFQLLTLKQLLFIGLGLSTLSLIAQDEAPFTGLWQGELTQIEGGFTDKYTFELYISPEAEKLTGRSYVHAQGVEGIMTFSGPIRGKICYLQEAEIVRSKKPSNMAWCLKSMQLRIIKKDNQWWLEGPWQGISDYGTCPPGMIRLKKVIPRV